MYTSTLLLGHCTLPLRQSRLLFCLRLDALKNLHTSTMQPMLFTLSSLHVANKMIDFWTLQFEFKILDLQLHTFVLQLYELGQIENLRQEISFIIDWWWRIYVALKPTWLEFDYYTFLPPRWFRTSRYQAKIYTNVFTNFMERAELFLLVSNVNMYVKKNEKIV